MRALSLAVSVSQKIKIQKQIKNNKAYKHTISHSLIAIKHMKSCLTTLKKVNETINNRFLHVNLSKTSDFVLTGSGVCEDYTSGKVI